MKNIKNHSNPKVLKGSVLYLLYGCMSVHNGYSLGTKLLQKVI